MRFYLTPIKKENKKKIENFILFFVFIENWNITQNKVKTVYTWILLSFVYYFINILLIQ